MKKMAAKSAELARRKNEIHGVISSLMVVVLLLPSCTAAAGEQDVSRRPLVAMLAKDSDTSLYTVTIRADKSPLVVDLAGSLIWSSTCGPPSTHCTVPCESGTCGAARQQRPRHCRYVDGGEFWAGREAPPRGSSSSSSSQCACTGQPLNPVTGECSTGDLTSFAMSANATNGTHVLRPEASFATVGACAPKRLLRSLPAGAAGVAGFSRRPLSLPSQLAAQRGFGDKFTLCLPAFATFGDTPVYLPVPDPRRSIDYVSVLWRTPLLTDPRNDGYYIPVKGILVSWHEARAPASLPAGALDLDAVAGGGGVALSTTSPYMTMRPDVFRAFAAAFDDAINRGKIPMTVVERVVPAPEPFELCYRGGFPRLKRPPSYDVPHVVLELGAGATGNWTLYADSYLVEVGGAMCLAILPAPEPEKNDDDQRMRPAVVIGGKQMENNLLLFDRASGELGFSGLLDFQLSACRSADLFTN